MIQPFLSERFAGRATRIAVTFLALASFTLVLAQIKPFWVDEWRIIYNLKYKDALALFGQLELVQQFPRLYLVAIKLFAATFDYSYFTLRFPSFIAGTSAIGLAYHLTKKLYKPGDASRYLFILIVISSPAFTAYYIQVKQYSMDILISLVALWQLLQLREVLLNRLPTKKYYLLLISLAIAPFFSYTYPVVAVPMLIVAFVTAFVQLKAGNRMFTAKKILPVIISLCSIIAFIIADASRAGANAEMRLYWNYLMMQHGFEWRLFFRGVYSLFAETGSGVLFQVIFGGVGCIAFVAAIVKLSHILKSGMREIRQLVLLYAVIVVIVALVLYVAGKIPIGEPRLNVFVLPSIAILILELFRNATGTKKLLKPAQVLMIVLYIGTIGHIFTAMAHQVTGSEHRKLLAIYEHTEDAIIAAQAKGTPIFITSDIAYPDEHMVIYPNTHIVAETMCRPLNHASSLHFNDDNCLPGDWVLKTFPAYKTRYHLPVYAIDDKAKVKQYFSQLPATVNMAVVGDGTNYSSVLR